MIIAAIIIIIILLFLFLTYTTKGQYYKLKLMSSMKKSPFVLDKKNVPLWAGTWPPKFTCAKSDVMNCIYSNLDNAMADCLNNANCVGYWARDGGWVRKPGVTLYQLVSDLNTQNSPSPGSFYKRMAT